MSAHSQALASSLRRFFMPWWLLAAGWAIVLLAACSPTFNWRELRPEGTPLQALMPCKPDRAERQVPLGGAFTTLHMQSCETGGLTFAVAWADVTDAARVPQALADWRRAALAAIRVDPAQAGDPARQWTRAIPGAQAVLGLKAQGINHQGQVLRAQTLYFSRGTQVFQAAIYGQDWNEDVSNSFFDGLRLP